MIGRGDRLVVALTVLLLIDAALALVCVIGVITYEVIEPESAHAVEFLHKPKDRPIMESMPRVWEARHTGVCRFHFDGVYYEVDDLPKEYVDYAAWYVRLP